MKYTKIKNCRLCRSNLLKPIINFGLMSLSSKFPSKKVNYKTKTPMIEITKYIIVDFMKIFTIDAIIIPNKPIIKKEPIFVKSFFVV